MGENLLKSENKEFIQSLTPLMKTHGIKRNIDLASDLIYNSNGSLIYPQKELLCKVSDTNSGKNLDSIIQSNSSGNLVLKFRK